MANSTMQKLQESRAAYDEAMARAEFIAKIFHDEKLAEKVKNSRAEGAKPAEK